MIYHFADFASLYKRLIPINVTLRLEYLRVRWFNKQSGEDCIFHFLRFIAFIHSYVIIALNTLPKITMLASFIATTSKRLDLVCPAANRTWQRLTIISCDLTHERDTYFLNISHIIYPTIIYFPRINRLQSKPLRLIKTNLVNPIIRQVFIPYA